MRRVYVSDYVPSRRVQADFTVVPTGPSCGSRGVGATFQAVTVNKTLGAAKGGKQVAPLTLPPVKNGPLAQRAEKTKNALRAGGGVRGVSVYYVNGYGVAGSSSQALYQQAITQAKQQVVDAVTAAQPLLDKIDSATLGVDSQLQALRDAAGPSAPNDVLATIDGAAQARQALGDSIDSIKATIDSMNAAAAAVPPGANIGNFGVGTPGQIALDKARQQAQSLNAQVQTIQRSVGAVTAKTQAATTTVNRYVDSVNAQAAALTAQQQQQATTTNIAYQLAGQQQQQQQQQATAQQQQALSFAQQTVQNAIANAMQLGNQAVSANNPGGIQAAIAMLQAGYVTQQAQVDTTGGLTAALAQAVSTLQGQMAAATAALQQQQAQAYAAAQAQQSAYVPPSYTQVQPPPPPAPYGGGAQYAQQYQPAPPPPQYYSQSQYDYSGAYPQPDAQYDATQYYGGEDGPGAAGPEWSTYVDGLRGTRGGVRDVGALPPVGQQGAPPSSSALAEAQARQILAQANLQIKSARNQIEQKRISDEQAAAAAKAAKSVKPGVSGMSTLAKAGIVVGIVAGGLEIAKHFAKKGHRHAG